MEYNDYNNASRCAEVKKAVEANGDVFNIWLTRNFNAQQVRNAILDSECSGIALEGEIPAEMYDSDGNPIPNPQAPDWQEIVDSTSDLNVYKAVVTNTSPFVHANGLPYPEIAAPLVSAGWKYLSECYDRFGNPDDWMASSNNYAKYLGWATTQPVLGLFAGRTLDSYPSRNKYQNWSVWAAEYIL